MRPLELLRADPLEYLFYASEFEIPWLANGHIEGGAPPCKTCKYLLQKFDI